jgi:hypothetical protein
MQPLTASPRQSLSTQFVTDLLQNKANIKIAYGAHRYDANLTYVQDITAWMSSGSSIKSDSTASIHRTCTLMLDSDNPVVYGTDFVKPYMDIIDPDTEQAARFYLGVYTLSTPTFDNSKRPSVLSITGYDLLYYLNQPVGDSVQVLAGADPITEAQALIAEAFPGAVINAVDTTSTLAADMTFPFDASNQTLYLDIVNQLLKSVGYQPLWVDWNGVFQLVPYVTPTSTNAEWTFDLSADKNIVAEARTSQQDLFSVPNWWRFVMQNLSGVPVEGTTQYTYVDNSAQSPGSAVNRKRLIKKIVSVSAADYAGLVSYAQSVVAQDLTPAEQFTVSTSPFPLAWQYDQILMIDPNLDLVPPLKSRLRRVQALVWTLPLDGAADMTWTWQTVAT